MQKRKTGNKTISDIWAIMIGLGAAILTMLVMMTVSAIFISNEYHSLEIFVYLAPFIQFLCAFVGASTAGKLTVKHVERTTLLAGAVLFVLQVCLALMIYDGVTNSLWVHFIVTVLGAVSGLLLVRRKNGSSKNKARRHR